MYSGPVIDTHMHLWDLANGYTWLSQNDANFERLFGNYEPLRRNFLAPDYIAMTRDCHVVKSVHVQAFGFPDNPVGETAWLQGQADQYGYPQGIVAYANLTHPDVEETLRRHCTCANVRGIRMPLNYAEEGWRRMTDRGDYMQDAQWRRAFALLSHYGLSFDLQMYDHQAAEAVALAQRFPETTIVIEHLAWPLDLSRVGFQRWSQHLKSLSQCSNVFLKLSGIGCVFRQSDPGWIRQWLQQAVSCFGPERCLFGSNCPPDTMFYDFKTLWRMYLEAFADYAPADQEAIFYGTAQRIYRL
jgi:predicted TIM-barrel fold metal-dependent hydrolase